MWIVTSYLHLSYVRHLRKRLLAHIPEYSETRLSWQHSVPRWARGVDILVLIAYGVPRAVGHPVDNAAVSGMSAVRTPLAFVRERV